nr:hypothetical protein [Tanacetum cinerariifolium]
TDSGFIADQDRATIAKSSTLPHDLAPRWFHSHCWSPCYYCSTASEIGPTASPTVKRRKGKEILVESDTPKKKKLQEQIDAQLARELEEQQEREDLRMNEQIARDAKVARIHAEEEIQAIIDTKFTQVWKRIEDFTPMGSKEEAEGTKRQGIILENEQVKKQKLSEEAPESKS